MQPRYLQYYKVPLIYDLRSSELVASNRSEMREGIEVPMEGEQARYYGNRTEHLHGRTILGYESTQDD